MWLTGEGLFSHNKIIPESLERQRLSNFVRQTRMATAVIEAPAKLPVCGLSRKSPGRAVSLKTHCCGVKSPFPFEPLNLFYSMLFAAHRSLSYVKKCWTHYTSMQE